MSFSIFQATQPGHPYWQWFRPPLGKKRRVLCSSVPCNQDCWHTGLRTLKVLWCWLLIRASHLVDNILDASLIGSDPHCLKGCNVNELLRNGFSCQFVSLLLPTMSYVVVA